MPREPLRVLLVDDEPDLVLLLQMSFEREHDIRTIDRAFNGMDALERVKEHCPDVVVLDFRMPDIDGIEAAARIKQICPAVKVILYSAHIGELFEESATPGVDRCLPKTTSPNAVADTIRTLCAA